MDEIQRLVARYPVLQASQSSIKDAAELLVERFDAGAQLLVCGNGGSAADSEHIVGELMKGFRRKRPVPRAFRERLEEIASDDGAYLGEHLQGALPAIALTGAVSLSTAFANDVSPQTVFAQQVYGYGRPGDVLLAISTSGTSRNVTLAAICAKALGLSTIALTGPSGGTLGEIADVTIATPGAETLEVQELHLPVYHALCVVLEERFFGE